MNIQNSQLSRTFCMVLAASVASPGLAQDVDLDNLGSGGFRILGAAINDFSGSSVSGAGDVNGDGLADLIVGASSADPNGDSSGASYVVFGKRDASVVPLAILGDRGFRIDGASEFDRSGFSVSGAGDVNGDGLADLIVGAYTAQPHDDSAAGSSYVVFGKVDGAVINLDSLGSGGSNRGFRIDGAAADDLSGFSVSGAGDVNGDGLADLIVGARGADPNGSSSAGESYVVFGKTDSTTVSLTSLANRGFRIDGATAGEGSGRSVSGAGDVNGDGLADLIVGAPSASPAGRSYVVFGKADTTAVNLGFLGGRGFRIDGASEFDRSGFSVSGAGDVNGDGLADLIVGAPDADPVSGGPSAGESYVVFGKVGLAAVDLASVGGSEGGGFRIDGTNAQDFSGASVAGAGDVNGDGLADLLVGAAGADPISGGSLAGESYVVFGKADAGIVDLASLDSAGFRISGAAAGDGSGCSVSGVGDVDGDGLADLIVGARQADPGISFAGESYVVFSQQTPSLIATYQGHIRNGDPPPRPIGTSGDGSNASHPDSRAWIDFADGAHSTNPASTETVVLQRDSGAFLQARAQVHWQLQTNRLNWSSAEVQFRYTDAELLTPNESGLQLFHSTDGSAPFAPLGSVGNPLDNTISAVVENLGFFYIGQRGEQIFSDGFE